MSGKKYPQAAWEEDTRFDGQEHWGGNPRWKHIFPKSGTPGTFIPIELDAMLVDLTDDEAGNSADQIDELEPPDAGGSLRGSQGKGARDQKQSGASRRWRQGTETKPPSSSCRRYSEEEEDNDAWLFRELKPRPQPRRDFSVLSDEEVEFDDGTAGIVGVKGTLASRGSPFAGDRLKKCRAQNSSSSKGGRKGQGRSQGGEQPSSDADSENDRWLRVAHTGSSSTLDLPVFRRTRSPGQEGARSLEEIDESLASGDEESGSDYDRGRDNLEGKKPTSFYPSPVRKGHRSAAKSAKGGVIREKGGRRIAPLSSSKSCASRPGSSLSDSPARRGQGGGSIRASRPGGKKSLALASTDDNGWIQKGVSSGRGVGSHEGAFKGSEAAMQKNRNRRLKQQTLKFTVEVDD